MVLYTDDVTYLANSLQSDIRMPFNVFSVNDVLEYEAVIKTLREPQNSVLQYVFLTLYNGSRALLD